MFAIFLSEGMDPFYQNIGSFPTVVFTLLFLICLLYWLVAVLGFIDIDILDFDMSGAHGDPVPGGHNEASTPEVLAGWMLRFGLHGVPVTVIVSLIALFGWVICYYIVYYLFGLLPLDFLRYLAGIPVLLGSFYGAAIITAQLIKPLRPLFKKTDQETVKKILGQTAVVRTSRVDNKFGEAVLADGGAGLILKVRATGEEQFKKGDHVVLLEHIEAENVYRVISEKEFTG